MAEKKQPTKLDWTVLKDYQDNGPHKKGETVQLTKRQATFLLSGGFIAPVAGTKAKKSTASES